MMRGTNKKKRAPLRKKRRERNGTRGENEGNIVGRRGVKDELLSRMSSDAKVKYKCGPRERERRDAHPGSMIQHRDQSLCGSRREIRHRNHPLLFFSPSVFRYYPDFTIINIDQVPRFSTSFTVSPEQKRKRAKV